MLGRPGIAVEVVIGWDRLRQHRVRSIGEIRSASAVALDDQGLKVRGWRSEYAACASGHRLGFG